MSPARFPCVLAVVLAAAIPLSETASAARHAHAAAAHKPAAAAYDEHALNAEILLDNAGFSPGSIDGREGDNFTKALHAFQQVNGLRVGTLDQQTTARLAETSTAPALTQYTVQPADVQGPFAPQIPQDFEQMAQLQRLAYHSPRQLLAEKFHMSEALLAALNPNARFDQAGTVLTVANVAPMPADPKLAARSGESSGSSGPPQEHDTAKVVVDKRSRAVLVYGANNRLLAFYPASIGSTEKPAPSGDFVVRSVAYDPDYTYNPAYAFKGQSAQRPVKIAPGPNNPVGAVWIGLSAPGYGIHGTPDPDKIGKTQSHGCVRLTNWDAIALAHLVKKGTTISFVG